MSLLHIQEGRGVLILSETMGVGVCWPIGRC
jgi:hypothetical protein